MRGDSPTPYLRGQNLRYRCGCARSMKGSGGIPPRGIGERRGTWYQDMWYPNRRGADAVPAPTGNDLIRLACGQPPSPKGEGKGRAALRRKSGGFSVSTKAKLILTIPWIGKITSPPLQKWIATPSSLASPPQWGGGPQGDEPKWVHRSA